MNAARSNQWQNSGEYTRCPLGCSECGGWTLIRKDEMAAIHQHLAGCSKASK